MSDIAMKENLFYWIRVAVLTLVLLFILMSCTAWASPLPDALSDAIPDRESQKSSSGKKANAHQCMFVDRFRPGRS
jgi:hypothetical protein